MFFHKYSKPLEIGILPRPPQFGWFWTKRKPQDGPDPQFDFSELFRTTVSLVPNLRAE